MQFHESIFIIYLFFWVPPSLEAWIHLALGFLFHPSWEFFPMWTGVPNASPFSLFLLLGNDSISFLPFWPRYLTLSPYPTNVLTPRESSFRITRMPDLGWGPKVRLMGICFPRDIEVWVLVASWGISTSWLEISSFVIWLSYVSFRVSWGFDINAYMFLFTVDPLPPPRDLGGGFVEGPETFWVRGFSGVCWVPCLPHPLFLFWVWM